MAFSVYFYTAGGHLYSVDEVANFLLAESLLRGRLDLTLDLLYAQAFHIISFSGLPIAASNGPNGQIWSKYGLTEPALISIIHLVASTVGVAPWFATDFVLYPTITALTVCLVFLIGRRLSYSPKLSLALSMIFGFATFAFPYAKFVNDGPLATFFLLAALWPLVPSPSKYSSGKLVFSGTMLGLAVLTRPFNVLLGLIVIIYVVWHSRFKLKDALQVTLPLLLSLFAFAYYNQIRFGSFYQFGYGFEQGLGAYNAGVIGIWGLLASPGVGLIFFFPLAVLLPAYYFYFVKDHKEEAFLFGSIFVVTLVFHGTYYWWHGWGYWGPRFLLEPLPLLVLSLGSGIHYYSRSTYHRALLLTLSVAGFVVNLLGVIIYFQTGFATLWSNYGNQWIQMALYVPNLSPIYRHLILATTNSLPVQTDFGYGEIVPGKKFDLYIYDKYGIASLAVLLAIVILFAVSVQRLLARSNTTAIASSPRHNS